MKVKELINLLKTISPEAEIYAWHDGEAHKLHDGSDCLDLSDDGRDVQINVHNSDEYIRG